MRMHISYIYIYIYIATSLENLYKVLINIALGCRPSNKTKKKKNRKSCYLSLLKNGKSTETLIERMQTDIYKYI